MILFDRFLTFFTLFIGSFLKQNSKLLKWERVWLLIIHKQIADYKIRISEKSFQILKSELIMGIFVKFKGCAGNG